LLLQSSGHVVKMMRTVLLAAYAASAAARFGANNAHASTRVAAPRQPWVRAPGQGIPQALPHSLQPCFYAQFSSPSGEADRVTSLPGMPAGNAPSQLYSGAWKTNATLAAWRSLWAGLSKTGCWLAGLALPSWPGWLPAWPGLQACVGFAGLTRPDRLY
jgi:hypothetical protein